MIIKAKKDDLYPIVRKACAVTSSKKSLHDVTQNLFFILNEAGKLSVKSTNLESEISLALDNCTVQPNGDSDLIVNAKTVEGFLKNVGGEVSLASSPRGITLASGSSAKIDLPTSSLTYPSLAAPAKAECEITIPAVDLAYMIDASLYCYAPDAVHNLVGIQFDECDGKFSVFASDSKSAATMSLDITAQKGRSPYAFRMSDTTARLVASLSKESPSESVTLRITHNNITILFGEDVFSTPRVACKEINWRKIVPGQQPHRAEFDRNELCNAVRIAALGCGDEDRAIDFAFGAKGKLKLAASNQGRNSVAMCKPINHNDPQGGFSLSGQRTLDVLSHLDGDLVTVHFTDNKRAVHMESGPVNAYIMVMCRDDAVPTPPKPNSKETPS